MQLIRLVPNRIKEINENTDMSEGFIRTLYSVLTRYSGYDEVNNQHYHYIPKQTGEKLLAKLDAIDLFCEWSGTEILDEKKGRFTVHMPTESMTSDNYILAEFF